MQREASQKQRLLNFAKNMRHTPTEAEAKIWYHLRAKRMCGVKFKRQAPMGFKVLRFWNNEVLTNIEDVLEAIRLNLVPTQPPSPPTPLPLAGEGSESSDF